MLNLVERKETARVQKVNLVTYMEASDRVHNTTEYYEPSSVELWSLKCVLSDVNHYQGSRTQGCDVILTKDFKHSSSGCLLLEMERNMSSNWIEQQVFEEWSL